MSSLTQERSSDVKLASAVMLLLSLSGCTSLDVNVPSKINALNGTTVKITCTFTSCYRIDYSKFAMHWTYQVSLNDTEVMFMIYNRKSKSVSLRSDRFGERVNFAGNLDKHDLSITLSDVKLEDEGIYNCYVKNSHSIQRHGAIHFNVVTELAPPRDSTIAVAIGASVGGALALLILSMVIVKCLRQHLKQDPIAEGKKEEEEKLDTEGVVEEGTKNP